ncbi:hypothetical protein H310_13548 [Aphanomyces invadans]|uniref:Nudix hydrolase domain-containing protein n=1 Tax=Aphanomyces invadans TaxID=157072 RepID=A0A024TFB1_9STRA|nr:hypothetical protein H310_13548 [Aphanomyces invadans]ETV92022.1 hypothetical protein H310_13548 [Aphanomyces invadans]|eukprot:XP_008879319.1 hypothetical protein H310_13548 [Aphanomyces invadans]
MLRGDAAPLQHSRVGRENQRYDGDVRLIVCIVPFSPAGQVLLISSSKHKDCWIFPKGGWETDESVQACASRELEEEAGVEGIDLQPLGEVNYTSANSSDRSKPSRLIGVSMRVTKEYEEWSESKHRQRRWVDLKTARSMLQSRPELLEMLNRAATS